MECVRKKYGNKYGDETDLPTGIANRISGTFRLFTKGPLESIRGVKERNERTIGKKKRKFFS